MDQAALYSPVLWRTMGKMKRPMGSTNLLPFGSKPVTLLL